MVVNQPLKRKGTPKDSDKAASEISGEGKRSEADKAQDWCLLGQTALRQRHSSVSCKTRPLTEGKTLTCSSKRFRTLSSLPATPSTVNLEFERKEDENADSVESGPKDHVSEVSCCLFC